VDAASVGLQVGHSNCTAAHTALTDGVGLLQVVPEQGKALCRLGEMIKVR
jgi:hypothetical protein